MGDVRRRGRMTTALEIVLCENAFQRGHAKPVGGGFAARLPLSPVGLAAVGAAEGGELLAKLARLAVGVAHAHFSDFIIIAPWSLEAGGGGTLAGSAKVRVKDANIRRPAALLLPGSLQTTT